LSPEPFEFAEERFEVVGQPAVIGIAWHGGPRAFNATPPRAVESKAASSLPVAQVYPASHENGLDAPPAEANQGHHDRIADDHAILDPQPVSAQTASSAPAPIRQESTFLNDNELLKGDHPESDRTVSEKPMMSEVAARRDRAAVRKESASSLL
jgi:hypothetical protein